MTKGYIVSEGHGEDQALPNLLYKLCQVSAYFHVSHFEKTIRSPTQLKNEDSFRHACTLLRAKRDCAFALFLRDCEDACPGKLGPQFAEVLRKEELPFPSAVVLFYREYETLFLASLPSLAGKDLPGPGGITRPGIPAGATYPGDVTARRDAKGEIGRLMGSRYKPSVDQLALTRHLDVHILRASNLDCFGVLERALAFCAKEACNPSAPGRVYPPGV